MTLHKEFSIYSIWLLYPQWNKAVGCTQLGSTCWKRIPDKHNFKSEHFTAHKKNTLLQTFLCWWCETLILHCHVHRSNWYLSCMWISPRPLDEGSTAVRRVWLKQRWLSFTGGQAGTGAGNNWAQFTDVSMESDRRQKQKSWNKLNVKKTNSFCTCSAVRVRWVYCSVVCLVRFHACSNNKPVTSEKAQQQINDVCTWWSESIICLHILPDYWLWRL